MVTHEDGLAFARSVVSGGTVASRPVRRACARSLREHGGLLPDWRFDSAKADRFLRYCQKHVRHLQGEWHDRTFEPLPWQAWVLSELFGWVARDTGYRRYRRLVLCTGKASGKNIMLAAIGAYVTFAEGEKGAECVVGAASGEQALHVFQSVVFSLRRAERGRSKAARRFNTGKRLEPYLVHDRRTQSMMRRISFDSMGNRKSGYNLNCALVDELHEHRTDALRMMLEAGMKARRQPLAVIATNAGAEASGHAYDYVDMARKIALGELENDRVLAVIAELDDPDEWQDERAWPQANPSLPVTPTLDYLRERAADAKGNIEAELSFKRLNGGCWMSAGEYNWLTSDQLDPCLVDERPDWVRGSCHLGVDLSRRRDMSAIAACWRHPEEDRYHVEVMGWLPEKGILQRQRRDGVPQYVAWSDAGYITLTPGDIIGRDVLTSYMQDLENGFGLSKIAADMQFFSELASACRDVGMPLADPSDDKSDGIDVVKCHQGYYVPRDAQGEEQTGISMSQCMVAMEEALLQGRLTVGYNPALRSAVYGARIIVDGKANRMFTKKSSLVPIDMCVATVMAVGCAIIDHRQPEYDMSAVLRWYKDGE